MVPGRFPGLSTIRGRTEEELYIKAPKEFQLGEDKLLKLRKPLYGPTDAGDYWHNTLVKHLKWDLRMSSTTGDLSHYVKKKRGRLMGIRGAYVDDTLSAADILFDEESNLTEQKF